jgi:predicted nucleic acid-binding protein
MSRVIILDSSPLALIVQRQRIPQADACRAWVKRHVDAETRVLIPEIVRYELRRELLRLRKERALRALEAFIGAEPARYSHQMTWIARRPCGLTAAAKDWSWLIRTLWTST